LGGKRRLSVVRFNQDDSTAGRGRSGEKKGGNLGCGGQKSPDGYPIKGARETRGCVIGKSLGEGVGRGVGEERARLEADNQDRDNFQRRSENGAQTRLLDLGGGGRRKVGSRKKNKKGVVTRGIREMRQGRWEGKSRRVKAVRGGTGGSRKGGNNPNNDVSGTPGNTNRGGHHLGGSMGNNKQKRETLVNYRAESARTTGRGQAEILKTLKAGPGGAGCGGATVQKTGAKRQKGLASPPAASKIWSKDLRPHRVKRTN